ASRPRPAAARAAGVSLRRLRARSPAWSRRAGRRASPWRRRHEIGRGRRTSLRRIAALEQLELVLRRAPQLVSRGLRRDQPEQQACRALHVFGTFRPVESKVVQLLGADAPILAERRRELGALGTRDAAQDPQRRIGGAGGEIFAALAQQQHAVLEPLL